MRRPAESARALRAAAASVVGCAGVACGAVLRRARVPAGLGVLSLALAACSAGTPVPPRATLSVVTANMANAADSPEGVIWTDRIDRFSAAISANGPAPDIISMTESAGFWHCWTPPNNRNAEDYDLVDRLISDLEASTGVRYRVAYLVGAKGEITNSLGTPHCSYYSGDTLLYNPGRLKNLTPDDVAGLAQESHDGPLIGFQVRRSLPLCVRGSHMEPVEQLIDGPAQTDRCNLKTHSGPAWAQIDRNRQGYQTTAATLARFALVDGIPGTSFDVITVHPQAHEEEDHVATIDAFIGALTGPRRTTDPYWPAVVVGDYNVLAGRQGWPAHTAQVAREGVMQDGAMEASVGSGLGRPPQRGLALDSVTSLPDEDPCVGPGSPGAFSDHCGMLLRFSATP